MLGDPMSAQSDLPFGPSGLVAHKHQLDNGLSVVLLRDSSAPVVAYQTWFRVGSRNEKEGRTGIAHLFEHLMFNQTENLPPGEFDKRIEALGGETNAATWVDWTYYLDNVPKKGLPTIIELEAERMQHLTLGHDQVESEREVVANERLLRVDDAIDGFLNEELYKLAFDRHPYHWPTIGWMKDIRAITIDDCRAFYRTYYAPNNATLVVVGDIDEDDVLARVRDAYGGIAAQAIPAEDKVVEAQQTEARRLVFDKSVSAERVEIGWRAAGQGEPDHATLELIADVLAGGNGSRLYRALVIERELCSSVHATVAPFRDAGLFEISLAMTRGHSAEAAEQVVDEILAAIGRDGPTAAELEGARTRLLTRFWMGLRPQAGKAEGLGHAETTLGDYRRLFEAPRHYAAVDREALRRAAAHYLTGERKNTIVARPLDGGDDDDGEEE
jgi:zinc protease